MGGTMSIVMVGSTSGSITLQEPAVAGSTVLSLPATTGNVVIDSATQTLTNKTLTTPNIDSAQFATVSGTAPIYPCRAWVNFDGTGTVSIRASGNITSITDHGTGNYSINFTTAMPDANYNSVGSCRPTAGGSPHYVFYVENKDNVTRSTTALRMYFLNPTDQLAKDVEVASVTIFR